LKVVYRIKTPSRIKRGLFLAIIDFEKWKAEKEENELYGKVIVFANSLGEISISAIQREFHLGYNHASAIMKRMEEEGLVGSLTNPE
jgi:DNA segregation ATPase FtsK/SpoIIIE-like protein